MGVFVGQLNLELCSFLLCLSPRNRHLHSCVMCVCDRILYCFLSKGGRVTEVCGVADRPLPLVSSNARGFRTLGLLRPPVAGPKTTILKQRSNGVSGSRVIPCFAARVEWKDGKCSRVCAGVWGEGGGGGGG